MPIRKLQSTDGFVVLDLQEGLPAIGIVRSAPKILQSGAKELARAQTYQCAALNVRFQGASAGINATPDDRAASIDAFASEVLPMVSAGDLMIDAGKGIDPAALTVLAETDPRSDARLRTIGDTTNDRHLNALGAVVCAEAVKPIDGASVAIESFELLGPSIARTAVERGARVTAVSTASGSAVDASGFDPEALVAALAASGPDFVLELAGAGEAHWRVLGAEADILFVGSKMGLIDHKAAPNVRAHLVVPSGPIPYTTKGALMLEDQGTTVLPDFVTTAGALLSGMPPGDDDQPSIEADVSRLLSELTEAVVAGSRSPILEACHHAESFLRSWRDELPFGRPFAP